MPEVDGQVIAGRGVAPTAVALATDSLMQEIGLHRVEINIVPENSKSLRVVEKLGFRHEGLKQRYIHINGAWRDHYVFALTREDLVPLETLIAGRGAERRSGSVLERWVTDAVPEIRYPWRS